jgi:uncharacterized membrane protein YgcG
MNTYNNTSTQPLTIMLSDQNQNSSLSGFDDSSLCIKTVRVEDAELSELVDILFEIFGKGGVPAGTVILLGSGSDLDRKGSSGYAWEICNQKSRIESRWPSVRVCLMPPILLCGGPVGFCRYLFELRGWIVTTLGTDPAGLVPVWNAAIDACNIEKTVGHPDNYYTMQYPDSLSIKAAAKYIHFENCEIGPPTVKPVGRKANTDIIRTLYHELNSNFSCGLGPGINLERTDDGLRTSAKEKLNFVVIGASHMKRVATILSSMGYEVCDLSEKSWVLSETAVEKLLENLGAVNTNTGTVVVTDPLSNSATKYRQADDSLALAVKLEGGWHLPGKIEMVGDEFVKDSLRKLKPIIDKLGACLHVIIPPLPRYLFNGCCQRSDHCTNTNTENFAQNTLQEHIRIRNTMKSHITSTVHHTAKKNFRILDLLNSLTPTTTSTNHKPTALKPLYAKDNVHLTHTGYTLIAKAAVAEAEGMKTWRAKEESRPSGSGRPINYWRGFVLHEGVGSISTLQWPAPVNQGSQNSQPMGGKRGGRGGRGGGGASRGGGGRGGRGSWQRPTPYSRN